MNDPNIPSPVKPRPASGQHRDQLTECQQILTKRKMPAEAGMKNHIREERETHRSSQKAKRTLAG
jgi:hypothetical protein